jgi:hypothetical protein
VVEPLRIPPLVASAAQGAILGPVVAAQVLLAAFLVPAVAVPLLATQGPVVADQVPLAAFQVPVAVRLQDIQAPVVVAAVRLQGTQVPVVHPVDFRGPAAVLQAATKQKSAPPPAVLAVDCPADQPALGVLQVSAAPEQQPLANQKSSASSFQPTPSD